MNIRPKISIFREGGLPSTVTWTPDSTWFTRSGSGEDGILEGIYNILKPLHDKWKTSGNLEDYLAYKKAVDDLNNNLRYRYAPGHLRYLSGNNQLFRGYGTDAWLNFVKNNYSFINDAIGKHFSLYLLESSNPTSGDNSSQEWKADNLWAGITDDRTPWGNLADPNDPNYLDWKKKFAEIGIDYRTNPEWETGDVLYGFLIENTPETPTTQDSQTTTTKTSDGAVVPAIGGREYGFNWSNFGKGTLKLLGNPDFYAIARLAGNLYNNNKVYNEQLKAIRPDLKQTYRTHRQVFGDEATKQGYYRRAAQGLTRASKSFTSNADRQMAYLFEAKRIGDELRAQGDLADNAEIRRTSDESNLHQWANTQRDTEVANANRASINLANALRHNLLALKHSAQWSSIDNFLQGIEYRKKQKLAELQALDDQIFTLLEKSELANDPDYIAAYNKYSKIIEENTDKTTGAITWNDTTLKAKREFEKAQTEALIRSYNRRKVHYLNRVSFAKSGTKITHKKKDGLLYKSTKDVVEHFRKMSKQSSDALNRKTPKIEKLTPHPKGKTKKYLLGGVAPFTVYKPVALGGETTTSSEASISSTKSSKDSDGLDLMKELFKSLAVEGLPSDVNGIYYSMNSLLLRQKAFGNELTSDDIASMYLQLMLRINTIKFNKALFDSVSKIVNDKDAGSEFAIDLYGRVAVQNTDTGKIEYKKWSELKESLNEGDSKFNPLTNNDLLNLRAYAPDQAFSTNLLQVASNATSMSEIAKFLKAQLPSIGSSESTIEGYTKLDSNLIRNGIRLLKDAPAGDYKFSQYTKDQLKQALMALEYLKNILPKNMRTLLLVNSELEGVSPNALIATMIGSTLDENSRLEFDAVTGKAAKDAKGNSKEGNVGDMIPAVAFFLGLGEQNTFVIQDKTSDGLRINTVSAPITSKGNNTGLITFDLLSSSDFGGQLRMDSATMGDSLIASNGGNNIIIGERIYQTELPIDRNAATLGIIKPDLSFLKNIEKADAKLKLMGIDKSDPKNIPTINKIYQENGLPIVYTIDGNKPILTSEYARFAMVNATATEDAFGEEPEFNDGVSEISDKERKQFEIMMLKLTNNSKYKLNNGWGPFGGTKVYSGIIYIPMVTSTISALGGTGYKGTANEYNLIETLQQQANTARQLGFKPAGDASNL